MKQKQSIPKHLRLTVEDFLSRFPDDEACLEYLKEKRYPNGMTTARSASKSANITALPGVRLMPVTTAAP